MSGRELRAASMGAIGGAVATAIVAVAARGAIDVALFAAVAAAATGLALRELHR